MASSSRSARSSGVPAASGLVTIGRIAAPHGVRGEVRVRPETDFPERFAGLRRAFLVRGGRAEPVTIRGARRHGEAVLLTLDGVGDRATADALRGAALAVARDALVPLGPDAFYVFEIVGLRVRAEDGRALGVVAEVMRGRAHDVYVVRGPAGEVLVPAVRAVVRRVDREAGELIVALPDGLEAGTRAR
ncbi:MAG: ribosome maturation factor RimM [Armatimonadota bacterium]|nr:ribosome maturation factor RimM [Armatimonadota bacterium]MDR7422076.1 ribosome maturation factor RimM [Armatimonadota bacterium]MDR7454140.1 ribosome maturation factor RimM [Armatimonadota bacterium]MDR7456239.1 ribosome maturation factor RimM [Armatimonadota bacterium]MDR7496893.1 ribosome maturation factor RimM [Armatimonadota bacterium]